MVLLQRSGLAAHHQTCVMWEKVFAIQTLNVLETLFVVKTTVEKIFRHLKLNPSFYTVFLSDKYQDFRSYDLSNLIIYNGEKAFSYF